MSNEHPERENDETKERLDEMIKRKKDEIAGLQRLLLSIEHPKLPESDSPPGAGEQDDADKNTP